jgi:hypothetical protein
MPVDRYYWQEDVCLDHSARLRALTCGFVWLLKTPAQNPVILASSRAELGRICDDLSAALPLAAALFAELKASHRHAFDDGSILTAGLYRDVSNIGALDACLAVWADDADVQLVESAMVSGAMCAVPRRTGEIAGWIDRSAPVRLHVDDLATVEPAKMDIHLPSVGSS